MLRYTYIAFLVLTLKSGGTQGNHWVLKSYSYVIGKFVIFTGYLVLFENQI
jgi:hypothetical protein